MKVKEVVVTILIIVALILYFIIAYFLYLLAYLIPGMTKIQTKWSKVGNKILSK